METVIEGCRGPINWSAVHAAYLCEPVPQAVCPAVTTGPLRRIIRQTLWPHPLISSPQLLCPSRSTSTARLYDKEDAKISVYDHGLLYGDGVFEGHAELRRQGVSPGAASRPAVGVGQGDLAGDPHDARRRWPRRSTTRWPPTASRTATSAWSSRAARARWASTPTAAANPQVIIIADHITLYPEGVLRERAGDRHRQHDPQPSGRPQPADQVAELPEQHPGQDRGAAGRLRRGPDAQPQGRSGRVHGRQHLPRARRRAAHAAASTPASWKASPATP